MREKRALFRVVEAIVIVRGDVALEPF